MSFFDTVEKLFHDWNYGHPKILWGLVRALKPLTAVEVGTYRGYAACYIAHALQENNRGRLYCIDNFSLIDHSPRYGDARTHFRSNLEKCGVSDFVTLVDGDSTKVWWPERVDFAYVDGWHSYLVAKSDFDMCAQRGASVICLDDTLNCVGPKNVVADLDRDIWDVATFPHDNGLTICSRKPTRRVTFSQELPGHPGLDITTYTDRQVEDHLKEMEKLNSVKYKVRN